MKRTSKSSEAPRWRIARIAGARGQEMGQALGPKSTDEAIRRAIRELGIDAEGQKRLAAYRVA